MGTMFSRVRPRRFIWENRQIIKDLLKDGFRLSDIHKILEIPMDRCSFYHIDLDEYLNKKPQKYKYEKYSHRFHEIAHLWDSGHRGTSISRQLNIPIDQVNHFIFEEIRKGNLKGSDYVYKRIRDWSVSDLNYIFQGFSQGLSFEDIANHFNVTGPVVYGLVNRSFRFKSRLVKGMIRNQFVEIFPVNDFYSNAKKRTYKSTSFYKGQGYESKTTSHIKYIPWEKCRRLALKYYGRDHFLYKICDSLILFNRWIQK